MTASTVVARWLWKPVVFVLVSRQQVSRHQVSSTAESRKTGNIFWLRTLKTFLLAKISIALMFVVLSRAWTQLNKSILKEQYKKASGPSSHK